MAVEFNGGKQCAELTDLFLTNARFHRKVLTAFQEYKELIAFRKAFRKPNSNAIEEVSEYLEKSSKASSVFQLEELKEMIDGGALQAEIQELAAEISAVVLPRPSAQLAPQTAVANLLATTNDVQLI